jgi:Uncharacterized conserved protein
MTTFSDTIRYGLKQWWWFLVIGILSLITGYAILSNPAEGYLSLSVLFTIMMIGSGFSQIFFAISSRNYLKGWGWTLASGILDLALGIFLAIYPTITMATLPFFVGFYLVFRGFYLVGSSLELNALGIRGWGWALVGGISLTILGFLTLNHPVAGAFGIVGFSGSAFIVNGIFSSILAFQLKSVKNDFEKFDKEVKSTVSSGSRQKQYHH